MQWNDIAAPEEEVSRSQGPNFSDEPSLRVHYYLYLSGLSQSALQAAMVDIGGWSNSVRLTTFRVVHASAFQDGVWYPISVFGC